MNPFAGAYGFRPLSMFSDCRDKPRGRRMNYFHNDVFALGVTFTRLLCSYEIQELANQFNRRTSLSNIAKYMGNSERRPSIDAILELGRNSLNRRIARCLNKVFGKQVVNEFTPVDSLQAAYQEVLRILLGPPGNPSDQLQGVLRILSSVVKGGSEISTKAIQKIRKMLNLALNPRTLETEAKRAWRVARTMMEKHNLSEDAMVAEWQQLN